MRFKAIQERTRIKDFVCHWEKGIRHYRYFLFGISKGQMPVKEKLTSQKARISGKKREVIGLFTLRG